MLPWLVTFHVTRLGFEAQNAAAFRFLRLVGNSSRTKADEIISDTIAPPRAQGAWAADLLMKTMERYDLLKLEQAPTCMRIEFVRARHEDDDQDPGKA
jgi:hypothetical protein